MMYFLIVNHVKEFDQSLMESEKQQYLLSMFQKIHINSYLVLHIQLFLVNLLTEHLILHEQFGVNPIKYQRFIWFLKKKF